MLLLSIHEEHVYNILAGKKTVELRKQYPRQLAVGETVLVYQTGLGIVATFNAVAIEQQEKNLFWKIHQDKCGVTKETYDQYFACHRLAVGIFIDNISIISPTILLAEIRQQIPNFHPPQGYYYPKSVWFNKINRNIRWMQSSLF